jgi:hypothetical protein
MEEKNKHATENDVLAWCREHGVSIRFLKGSVRIEADPKGLLLGKGETLLHAFQDLQEKHNPERLALIDVAHQAYYGLLMANPQDASAYDEAYGDNERWALVVKAIVRYLKSHGIPSCFMGED